MIVLEKLITLVTTLFTLSLVSERVINWMKLYFGQAGKKFPFFTNRDEDISKQSNDPKLNTIRERKILGLNITVGILIAFLAHANLFEILRSVNPAENLGWNTIDWPDRFSNQIWLIFNNIIGCTLSGLCMSMGSKFWHDTLDLLFYSKNLRQKMVEKETDSVQPNDPTEKGQTVAKQTL